MLSSSLALFLVPAVATAKLWGWPDSFTVTANLPTNEDNPMRVCPGWGTWCGDCAHVQDFQLSPGGLMGFLNVKGWDWAHIKKENSAWVDFWRQGKSDTFNMYESNQDGTVHGQCQIVDFNRDEQRCGDRTALVLLHCWQW